MHDCSFYLCEDFYAVVQLEIIVDKTFKVITESRSYHIYTLLVNPN